MDVATQVRKDEGLRLNVYRDSVGIPTIGWGRNLHDVGISKDEAEYLFANDLGKARLAVAEKLPWSTNLNEPRQAVLINMAFNMGIGGLLKFDRTLELIEASRFTEASVAVLQSKWAKQVGARAYRLAKQLESGEWSST